MPYQLDGSVLTIGYAFKDAQGNQYPANWLGDSTKEDRDYIGIVEVPDPEPYDSRFYTGRTLDGELLSRPLDDQQVELPNGHIQDVPGLRSYWLQKQKTQAQRMLTETDWYVIRKSESGTAIPASVAAYREAVREASNLRGEAISAVTTTDELHALITAVQGTEGGLPAWPSL